MLGNTFFSEYCLAHARSLYLLANQIKKNPSPPLSHPYPLLPLFIYDKSNTPTPKYAARPATLDGSSRPSCPEKLEAPTGVGYQGVQWVIQCRVERRAEPKLLMNQDQSFKAHFSFIVSGADFRMCNRMQEFVMKKDQNMEP